MTSEILEEYNRHVEEQQEICYKNNRSKEHDWESINTVQISRNIIEVEYFCISCGNLKYCYNYLEDDQL
jgi:hypothetical protein